MKTPVVLLLVSFIPIHSGFAQSGGSGGQAQVRGFPEVAPAATVVPDRLVSELLTPRVVWICGPPKRCRLWSNPEGRTYGQTAVRRLQWAWRDSRSPKPESKMPQSPAKGAKPESSR